MGCSRNSGTIISFRLFPFCVEGPEAAAGCQNPGLFNTEVLRWTSISQGPDFIGWDVTVGEGPSGRTLRAQTVNLHLPPQGSRESVQQRGRTGNHRAGTQASELCLQPRNFTVALGSFVFGKSIQLKGQAERGVLLALRVVVLHHGEAWECRRHSQDALWIFRGIETAP